MKPKQMELRKGKKTKPKTTIQNAGTTEEDDILMEYAMEQEIYMQDPEERQYEYHDIEEQIRIF